MANHRFYQIPRTAYLYGSQLRTEEAEGPEESVRQWCAFELMRLYGVKVTNLVFEHPVKVGSRNDLRIDILVLRNGDPWMVVECKRSDHTNHEKAAKQAISYADAQTVRAPFAMYTNGAVWNVYRKVTDQWEPIPDLPTLIQLEAQEHFVDILQDLHQLKPLIHKLDEKMDTVESMHFLSAMQYFFNGYKAITDGVSKSLLDASDNLLRAVTHNNSKGGYQMEKIAHAGLEWAGYSKRVQASDRFHEVDRGNMPRMEMSTLCFELRNLIKASTVPHPVDVLLLRLNIALLEYAVENETRRSVQPLGPAVHHPLRDFLNHLLVTRYHTSLPDPIDVDAVKSIKIYCEPEWTAFVKSDR
jgi:hypothetical protein